MTVCLLPCSLVWLGRNIDFVLLSHGLPKTTDCLSQAFSDLGKLATKEKQDDNQDDQELC